MATLVSIDADSAWPDERVYNFKITKAGINNVRTQGDNEGKPYVACQTEIVNSPEANGEVGFLNLMLFNKRGERDFLALVKAVTGSPLTGQHELDSEAVEGMLKDGLFSAKLVHQKEDGETIGTNIRAPFKPFDPELENEDADSFSTQF